MVARMHLEGKGVEADPVMAHAWYTLSASQGNEEAMHAKAELEKGMCADQLSVTTRMRNSILWSVQPSRDPIFHRFFKSFSHLDPVKE